MTIHDTDVDGTAPFNANTLAKAKLGDAVQASGERQFRPGSQFREFFFDETGDTSAADQAGADFGGFGGVLKLDAESPHRRTRGTLALFYLGDVAHTGLRQLRVPRRKNQSCSSRTPATACTPSATRSTRRGCST